MSSTIDQQFVEYIVKSLVGDPDSVVIKRTIDEKGVLLELTVAQEDLGRVIGKRGATAQSIRTLLRALGTKNEARYNFKIVDPEGGPRPSRDDNSQKADDDSASKDEPKQEPEPEEEAEEQEQTPEDASTEVMETTTESEEETNDSDEKDDSMVARHRRDLEDLAGDDL